MAISAPHETLAALGNGLLPKCESRSLFQARFADPQASDKTTPTRKAWFNALTNISASRPESTDWLPANACKLHARLMSRLMVDLAGSVMENAHVRLDRFGLPIIPGSAVKGCARRMALQALHDWIEDGTGRPAADDACAPCCGGFETPAAMLAAIARIFGWTPEDWKTDKKDGHYKSDVAWATKGDETLLQSAKAINPDHETFAGTIAFLPASPNTDPGLELDVLTPHHTEYYKSKDPNAIATDTEDPTPIFFPAVKLQPHGDYFTFPLIPLRLAKPDDLTFARCWLAHGLELLGLGAKTHAGYGCFQVLSNGRAEFADRFKPVLSAVDSFIHDWGGKPINGMNARGFSKLTGSLAPDSLRRIFETIAPGKIDDFKDPFWNPFKTDPAGKALLEKIRTHP